MALRTILTAGDEMLQKKCRPVTAFDDRLATLLDDMTETLLQSGGVGLAAPQVGVLRRVVVLLDINKDEEVVELVNPEVIEMNELEKTVEGCLSVPGKYGMVKRPMQVTVRYQDRGGEWHERTAEGFTARAFCHEIDHLDGHLYTELVTEYLDPDDFTEDDEGEDQ